MDLVSVTSECRVGDWDSAIRDYELFFARRHPDGLNPRRSVPYAYYQGTGQTSDDWIALAV